MARLDELTEKRNRGRAIAEEASEEARPLVEKALIAGVRVIDLIGRPYSRPEVQNIKKALRDAGRLPES